MLTTYNIPVVRMRQAKVEWDIDWRGSPTRESLSGNSGVIINSAPRWYGRPTLRLDATEIGHWRRHRWRAQGRANAYRLTMYDPAIYNPANTEATVPAQAVAAIGAESIRLTITDSSQVPSFGQILSADDWPMGVTDVTDLGSNVYEVDVQPPLRAALAINDPVRLVGQGVFQAADDQSGRMVYDLFSVADAKWSFIEVLNR